MLIRLFNLLVTWSIGGIFFVAAIPKILNPEDFAYTVFSYQLLPYDLINLFAMFLPCLEIVAALALIFRPAYRLTAALIIGSLLVVFTAAIGFNLWRGTNITCGCFSREGNPISWLNIVRNLLLLAGAGWIGITAYFPSTRRSYSSIA